MNVEIAERLAARRREMGYSQEALALKLGVSRQAVSKWERSESSPDTDNLIALAKLYGVSLDELLYVDKSIEDDVEFEAADRAEQRQSKDKPPTSGIHFEDDGDEVHLSWKDGVHIKSANDGEEVRVGWDGIHISEPGGIDWQAEDASDGHWGKPDSFSWSKAGIDINGEHFNSWDEVQDKYGDRAKSWKHEHTWLKFPFPLLAIIAYLLIGFFANEWAVGLFVFFTIPLYYITVHAAYKRKPSQFVAAVYPLGCIAWFLYMAFVLAQPHPAWVIFLTIPIVEWICVMASRAWKRRKNKRETIEVNSSDLNG